MDVRDDNGLAESASELAPCPYCDGKDCKHALRDPKKAKKKSPARTKAVR